MSSVHEEQKVMDMSGVSDNYYAQSKNGEADGHDGPLKRNIKEVDPY